MEKFTTITGLVVPLDRANVDTDAIIPKQFLKSIKRTGFGPYLFDEWRYLDHGEPDMDCSTRPLNPDFVLNHERYRGAQVLLTRENFGCGSSREHAPWALLDYGFRAIIAPSFADIFKNNCFKNGVLPVEIASEKIDQLFAETEQQSGYSLQIDLDRQCIVTPTGEEIAFDVDPFKKHCLLNGYDDIDLTLQHQDDIRRFEQQHKEKAPWMFGQEL